MIYDELVKRLRELPHLLFVQLHGHEDVVYKAADAIEDLNRQRDRAYARLCEWCGVCPEGKRNAEDCEIAALNPEPQKEEA